MKYHIIEAKYINNYNIWLKFKDGFEGKMDFSDEFDGPIFEPLKKIKYFKSFIIEGNTICWDNGADFAPEYLYQCIKNRTATVANR
ncbi:MAG TPA: DUF2442 domain-containing protein [Spirochaetes bacterium]|nr:DUF2442 domain-containing protein [Spirochaetota bacterium]